MIMIAPNIIESLKNRYNHYHPLLFQRSVEFATSGGDLFDILDTVPKQRPIAWNADKRRWGVVQNLTQAKFADDTV